MGPTYATFGNTYLSKSFNFTFSPGVVPSVCYIQTVPHVPTLAQDGTLRLVTDDDIELVFPDAKLEQPRLEAGLGGAYWTLPILDRRWKWQFAWVSGSFNIPRPDGTWLREKTPQELAAILLRRMGESGFDVSRLPNAPRPECHWEPPARADIELEKLCTDLGCVVVLNHLTNLVELWPVGDGLSLPTGGTDGASYAPVQLATPERIRIEAGNTLFQDAFTTEPVGLDVDDQWRHIDQLSYKPVGGWKSTWPPGGFPQIKGKYTRNGRELNHRDLAEATVFRCYRLTGLLKGGWVPSHMAFHPLQPQSVRDLKLFDELADEELSERDGGLRRLPAVSYVRAWSKYKSIPAEPVRYQGGFSIIDSSRGIIQFTEPQFRTFGFSLLPPFEIALGIIPATVWFECSFHAGQDGVMHRLNLEQQLQTFPTTPTRVIHRPEILYRAIQRYATDGTPIAIEDNLAQAQPKLQFWRDAALQEYRLQQGGTLNWPRLLPITLDGLTQQITWSAGERTEARTTASQAQRHNRVIRPPDEYRERLAAKRAENQLDSAIRAIRGQDIGAATGGIVV